MATRVRAHPWHETPLGPIDTWSDRLRATVDAALDSAFACFVFWGPELTQIYNDAAIEILRERHPVGLGKSTPVIWKDSWRVVGSMIERVLETGVPEKHENLQVPLVREGKLTPAYFSFCYSALRDDDGRIVGIYATAIETTNEVLATADLRERDSHHRCLLQLTDYLSSARDAERIRTVTTRRLSTHLGATCAYFLEFSSATDTAWVSACQPSAAAETRPGYIQMAEQDPLVSYHIRSGLDLTVDRRRGLVPLLGEGAFIAASVQAPMPHDPAFLVVQGSPDRIWNPQEEDLVREAACRGWAASQWARAEAALRESEERFRGVYQHAAIGIAICDLRGRLQRCNPALARILGRSCEDLEGTLVSDLTHEEDRAADIGQLQAARLSTTEATAELVVRYARPEGNDVWAQRAVFLLRGEQGEPTHLVVLISDISERKAHEAHVERLLCEVNHRSKNLLSLVQIIARSTAEAGTEGFLDRFEARIRSLIANQDLLVASGWKGATVADLLRSQLAHLGERLQPRVDLDGPPLMLSASSAQTLGMVVHELATNACKYGALSAQGRVVVRWKQETADTGEALFVMQWSEDGGRAVQPPERAGYGLSVIDEVVEAGLDAEVTLDFRPTGLQWRLRAPLATVTGDGHDAERPATVPPAAASQPRRQGRPRLLVVEDHVMLARVLTRTLTGASFDVLGPCKSADEALALLESETCDGAVLDVHLGEQQTSEPVARALRARGIPFIALTGYSPEQVPGAFAGVPVLTKPAGAREIVGAVQTLVASQRRHAPDEAAPELPSR